LPLHDIEIDDVGDGTYRRRSSIGDPEPNRPKASGWIMLSVDNTMNRKWINGMLVVLSMMYVIRRLRVGTPMNCYRSVADVYRVLPIKHEDQV
jgi:hypothetical protein